MCISSFADGDMIMRHLGLGVGHVGVNPTKLDRYEPVPIVEYTGSTQALSQNEETEWDDDALDGVLVDDCEGEADPDAGDPEEGEEIYEEDEDGIDHITNGVPDDLELD